jgi:glutamate--cysteine ligase
MIKELADKIASKDDRLKRWYEDHLARLPGAAPPVYASVDIRNSGYKIAVVDTNLFPAGFNNLCETFSENGSRAFRNYFKRWHPHVEKILIFPEEHTRNPFYWKNVSSLLQILSNAGMEVRVGSASTLLAGDPLVQKIFLSHGYLRTEDFVPDAILINNDLSAGTPEYLKGIHQPLLPSPHLGWHRRRKSDHFALNEQLIGEASEILEIDPWLLSPMTTVEKGIDLDDEICLKRLQESADRLLAQIRRKYLQYGIRREPYLFVKNNSGTYGLGIIHIQSGSELLKLNRRSRNKLQSAKGGQRVTEYLLQEGIPTADLYGTKPLEPVVYLVGGEAIGTFFRIHEGKNERDSLNAPGMDFTCLCLHKVEPPKKRYHLTYENKDQLFTVASLLGRIASLASTREFYEARRAIARETA